MSAIARLKRCRARAEAAERVVHDLEEQITKLELLLNERLARAEAAEAENRQLRGFAGIGPLLVRAEAAERKVRELEEFIDGEDRAWIKLARVREEAELLASRKLGPPNEDGHQYVQKGDGLADRILAILNDEKTDG